MSLLCWLRRKRGWRLAAIAALCLAAAAIFGDCERQDDALAQQLMASYEEAWAGPLSPLADLEEAFPGGPGAANVPVFMYHSIAPWHAGMSRVQRDLTVEPAVFEEQMRHLKENGFTAVRLEALVDHLLRGTPLPEKPVVLTFDDGWDNQYRFALPILVKYGHQATFFVTTDFLGHGRFLTWPQLKEMESRGMSIGSHTMSHPFLARLSDPRVRREVEGSKTALEKFLGHPVRTFAYPYGSYNNRVASAVRAAGYDAARSVASGRRHSAAGRYGLRCLAAVNSLKTFRDQLAR